MVPYLHVRFPFLEGKNHLILVLTMYENLLKMLPIWSDSVLSTFLMGRKTLWQTEPQCHRGAAISTPKSHLHVQKNCSKRTKQAGAGWILSNMPWVLFLDKCLLLRRWQCQTHAKGALHGKSTSGKSASSGHSDPCPCAHSQGTNPSWPPSPEDTWGHQRDSQTTGLHTHQCG